MPMAGKKSENKAIGVSRGGRNTKIHTLVDGLGNPLAFMLSSGSDHDSIHAVSLPCQVPMEGSNILGDKAYGAKAIREYIVSRNASYTIPPKCDVIDPWPVDWHLPIFQTRPSYGKCGYHFLITGIPPSLAPFIPRT